MAYDIQEKILNKDGAYINILPVSKASLIKTADDNDVQQHIDDLNIHITTKKKDEINAHISDTTTHITATERGKWNKSGINTYVHKKNGTVHNLQGVGNNIEFLATADIADGDSWQVNGTTVTATLSNGKPLTEDTFKSGNWVTGVRFDRTKLNFRSGGKRGCKYNVFVQPNKPTMKHGIWLKTNQKEIINKIVFDTDVWASQQWGLKAANLPVGMSDACCATVGDKIYIFGGRDTNNNNLSTATVYNPSTNTYRSIAKMPKKRNGSCCATVGNKIYIFGGYTYDAKPLCYDVSSDTYHHIQTLPLESCYFSCATVGDKIYIFGGTNSNNNYSSATEYNTSTNMYRSIAKMPEKRNGSCCATVGNKIYIFGGSDGNKDYSSAIVYNPSTNMYRSIAKMPEKRSDFCCTVSGNKIYIFGGRTLSSAVVYSPSTNTYQRLDNMSTIRISACSAAVKNEIFVFGGQYDGYITHVTNTVDRLSLISKQYPIDNSVVIHYSPGKSTYITSLITTKICDYLPCSFIDAMWFKNNRLRFPELYNGNGYQWTKLR